MNIYDNSGKDITNNANFLKQIGIYKFYVKKEVLDEIFNQLEIKNYKNIEKYPNLELGEEYFCIYVGQTRSKKGFYKRIIKQHVNGNSRISTLRKSLKGILRNSNLKISEIFKDKSMFVIIPISNVDLILDKEFEEINKNNLYRPLNLNDNNYYKSDLFYESVRDYIKKVR